MGHRPGCRREAVRRPVGGGDLGGAQEVDRRTDRRGRELVAGRRDDGQLDDGADPADGIGKPGRPFHAVPAQERVPLAREVGLAGVVRPDANPKPHAGDCLRIHEAPDGAEGVSDPEREWRGDEAPSGIRGGSGRQGVRPATGGGDRQESCRLKHAEARNRLRPA
jgi:hypothetical protein